MQPIPQLHVLCKEKKNSNPSQEPLRHPAKTPQGAFRPRALSLCPSGKFTLSAAFCGIHLAVPGDTSQNRGWKPEDRSQRKSISMDFYGLLNPFSL